MVGICAALAIVHGLRLYSAASIDVDLVYHAPKGELVVTLFDAEGERLRRSTFGSDHRAHTVTLPTGDYVAELRMPGKPAVRRPFRVEEEQTVELHWQR